MAVGRRLDSLWRIGSPGGFGRHKDPIYFSLKNLYSSKWAGMSGCLTLVKEQYPQLYQSSRFEPSEYATIAVFGRESTNSR